MTNIMYTFTFMCVCEAGEVEERLRGIKISWGGEKGFMGEYGQNPQYSCRKSSLRPNIFFLFLFCTFFFFGSGLEFHINSWTDAVTIKYSGMFSYTCMSLFSLLLYFSQIFHKRELSTLSLFLSFSLSPLFLPLPSSLLKVIYLKFHPELDGILC